MNYIALICRGSASCKTEAPRIEISYNDVPADGEIRFGTSDIQLITAVHRWFGAQLSEHGADAVSEYVSIDFITHASK